MKTIGKLILLAIIVFAVIPVIINWYNSTYPYEGKYSGKRYKDNSLGSALNELKHMPIDNFPKAWEDPKDIEPESITERQDDILKRECIEVQSRMNEKIEYVNSLDYIWTAFVEWTSEQDSYAIGDGISVQSQIKLINNETGTVKVAVPYCFDNDPKNDMR